MEQAPDKQMPTFSSGEPQSGPEPPGQEANLLTMITENFILIFGQGLEDLMSSASRRKVLS